MKKPVLISNIALHIILTVRKIRKELGFTQREISNILSPASDNNALGPIESSFRTNTYTDENLNKIAKAFTEKAQQLGTNKKYSIYDFYPSKPLEEKLVEKVIL